MSIFNGIKKAEIKNVLGKGWLTHDAMWFYHTHNAFGMQKANELNKAAIKSLAPIEVDRMKRLLGIPGEDFESLDGLMKFMQTALELTLPGSVFSQLSISLLPDNTIGWEWNRSQCFAYKGMKQTGMIGGYSCGVIYRIECWLDALCVGYLTQPAINGCLMHEKGSCKGEIHIDLKRERKKR